MKRRCTRFIMLLGLVTLETSCRDTPNAAPPTSVVVYVAVDQFIAEPILQAFERESGVRVLAVYDTEAAKTTGLVGRLIAEHAAPRADVFWNNEIAQTIEMKRRGLLAAYVPSSAAATPERFRDQSGYWTGVCARLRVFVYNTQRINPDELPRSLKDLLAPRFVSQVAIAYPLFGTTRTHAAALFARWGHTRAESFFRDLMAAGTQVVDGNATVRDLVAEGRVSVGLVDSDDAYIGLLRGSPIGMVIPDQDEDGALLLPTTVAILRGGPHPQAARRLVDFLVSDRVETLLAQSDAAYIPLRPGVPGPPGLPAVDEFRLFGTGYEAIADALPEASEWLRKNVSRGSARGP